MSAAAGIDWTDVGAGIGSAGLPLDCPTCGCTVEVGSHCRHAFAFCCKQQETRPFAHIKSSLERTGAHSSPAQCSAYLD
jgi:hypothetical protein